MNMGIHPSRTPPRPTEYTDFDVNDIEVEVIVKRRDWDEVLGDRYKGILEQRYFQTEDCGKAD